MDPCVIFMLAQTSSRARRLTKMFKMDLSLILLENSNHFMFARTSDKPQLANIIDLSQSEQDRQYRDSVVFDRTRKLPCDIEWKSNANFERSDYVDIQVYCLDRMDTLRTVLTYFFNTFTVRFKGLTLLSNNIGDRYQVMDYTKRLGLNFLKICWVRAFEDDLAFPDVFDNFTTELLDISLYETDMFSHTRFQNARIKKLFLTGGRWNPTTNLNDFLNCGSVHITYNPSDSAISSEDLNAFIKAWLATNSPLILIQIEMRRAPKWRKIIKTVAGVKKDGRVYKLFKDGVEVAHILWRDKCFFFVEKQLRDSSDEKALFLGSVHAKCRIAEYKS